jgi:hypothetical protein
MLIIGTENKFSLSLTIITGTQNGHFYYVKLFRHCPLPPHRKFLITELDKACPRPLSAERDHGSWSWARDGALLFKTLMGPGGVVVGDEGSQDPAQMSLIENQAFIQTLFAHGPHSPLGESVGVGCLEGVFLSNENRFFRTFREIVG